MAAFRSKTRPARPDAIDLHGKGKAAALQATHDKLDAAARQGVDRVTVITGRGLHSPGGKPIIRPAIDAFLDRNCFWREPESNPGRYKVVLNAPLDI